MTTIRITTLFLILFLGCAGICRAGYDEGVAAYKKGDYATAYSEFLVLAEAGHDSSQYDVGVMYAKGQYVAKDFVLARKWFAAAAAQGQPMAQGSLGVMFAKGQGGEKDLAEAKYWLDTALANPRAPEAYKKTAKQALDDVLAAIGPDDLERAKLFAADRPAIKSVKKYKMSSAFMQTPEDQQNQPPANFIQPGAAAQAAPPTLRPAEPDQAAPAKPETPQAAEPEKASVAKPEAVAPAEPEKSAAQTAPEKSAVAKPDAAGPDDEDQSLSNSEDENPKAESSAKHKKHKKKKKKKDTKKSKKTAPKAPAPGEQPQP
jgi:hypothetical protein